MPSWLCSALPSRAPQEYEPWAAALPYMYKMARLLPKCYSSEAVEPADWVGWQGLHRGW